MSADAPAIVIMGVSGSGKSMLGTLLAARRGYDFVEGDTLHPVENVRKMSAGTPLDDADRWPWLNRIAAALDDRSGSGRVVSCSALKRSYRDFIRARVRGPVIFIFPDVSDAMLTRRVNNRPGHYMPPGLLASQLATLERPQPDERVAIVDGAGDPEAVLRDMIDRIDIETSLTAQVKP